MFNTRGGTTIETRAVEDSDVSSSPCMNNYLPVHASKIGYYGNVPLSDRTTSVRLFICNYISTISLKKGKDRFPAMTVKNKLKEKNSSPL